MSEKQVERRYVFGEDVRIERRAEGEPSRIVGYSARFNTLSEELWGFREQIAPGAFADVLKNDDVRALFNHDSNLVLGRNKAGTLELREDETGLWMEATPPDTQAGRDVVTLIDRRDVTGQSFSFLTESDTWEKRADGIIVRTLVKVGRLYDVGPVTFPAYPDTDVAMRSVANSALERFRALAAEARVGKIDPGYYDTLRELLNVPR